MAFTRLFLASLLLAIAELVHAQNLAQYTVTKVYDGDTIELADGDNKFKLRLADIDAPERNQAYGKISRRALDKLCKGENIKISARIIGTDKYHRVLGRLQCNGTDASLYMAGRGLAWHYEKYSADPAIRQAASTARKKRIGLWQDSDPLPPWLWRKQHPNLWREWPERQASHAMCAENLQCEDLACKTIAGFNQNLPYNPQQFNNPAPTNQRSGLLSRLSSLSQISNDNCTCLDLDWCCFISNGSA